MNEMQRFGALLRSRRKELGMTQEDLGRITGRPHSYFTRLERGEPSNPPDPHVFDELSRVLDVPKRAMLEALGYLDPEELEPGVTHVVRKGDPRGKALDMLKGLPAEAVEIFIETARPFVDYYRQNNMGLASSGDTRDFDPMLGSGKGNKAS